MTARARLVARLGAAAFLAGASLAAGSTAVATADRSDAAPASDSPSADSPSAGSPSAGSPSAGQPTRGVRPGPRGGGETASATGPRAAAARDSLRDARAVARSSAGRVGPESDTSPIALPTSSPAPPGLADRTSEAAVVAAPASPAPAAAPAAPPTQSVTPDAALSGRSPAAAVVTTAQALQPSPARPGAVAAVTASAGANASSAALIDRLLAPIRALFGEGTALLVRRTFFNQAPTTAPVQLTGQSEGPITGTIGAVDPEGDQLSYAITGAPLHGSAVVNADGSYTYTPNTDFTGADNFVVSVTDTGFHINLLDLRRPDSTSANVDVARGGLPATLRFQFIYGSGSLFWSSAARSALESAARTLASAIVVDSPVTITYAVTGAKSPLSSTLASAGSDFVNDGSGFLQTVVQSKILSGNDANGSAADGTIDWNFGPSWAFGSAASTSQYDFQSIAMHELLHTFGFLSNIDRAGSNNGQVWTVFDSFVVNSAGTRVINSNTYAWNSAYNANLTGGYNGLYFSGPQAVAAYAGLVPLYTPNPWEPGSSLSHLNDGVFSGSKEQLMNAVTSMGPGIRTLSPVELGVLADIGYTVTGPGAPALLFFGLITVRRRRI